MQQNRYPWKSVPSDQRRDFVAALAERFRLVHFTGYRRAQLRDLAKNRELFTPHPGGISHHKSGRLVYPKSAPWIEISRFENALILELMKLELLFVEEND